MTKSINIISKLEKITKQDRYFFVKTPFVEKLIIFILLFICVFSLIPIIFINTLQGISIALICFGILNRDGLFIIFGLLCGFVSAIAVYYAILGIKEIILNFFLKKVLKK